MNASAATGVLDDLVGDSAAIIALRQSVRSLLQRQATMRRLPPILIQGETGTGKGLLARLIHRAGPRARGPFVDVNCAAIPEALLEAELFGRERGAYTDARESKAGLFQTADGGTLFLDEVGLLPLALQAKLLKALEEGVVRRLGATRTESVNASIVTATNEDLPAAVKAGRFRPDLYHRLAVLPLSLPPLRERGSDIDLLAERLLARTCSEYGVPAKSLSDDARAALRAHAWPGNVRELGNVLERVALLSESRTITAETLGLPVPARSAAAAIAAHEGDDALDRQRLLDALTRTGWNISRTAAALDITRNTVRARIQRYGLRRDGALTPADESDALAPSPREVETPARTPVVAAPVFTVRWERRRVTLLRARLLADERAPSPAGTRLLDIMVEKVGSFGGRVEEMSPRLMVAAFGVEPTEDAPRRAANSALAILRAVGRERSGESAIPDVSVSLAIHVGRMLVARVAGVMQVDHDAKRDAAAVFDQMEPLAAGEIGVTDAAAPFLGRHFDIVDVDQPGRVVHRLVGRESSGGRAQAAEFVGRDEELGLLRTLLDRAVHGHGQIVSIAGDPGIGKSRLLRELQGGVTGDAVTIVEGRCVSYGTTVPYLAAVDVIRAACGIQEADASDVVEAKMRALLDRIGPVSASWTPYLLHLLHLRSHVDVSTLAPDVVKERTFDAIQQLIVWLQDRGPLLVVVEDLHWCDTATEELLGSLAELIPGKRILVATTYRPGYRPPWIGKSHATQIALPPLSTVESRRLVESVTDTDRFDEGVVATILSRAEGNPFFLEELARVVGEVDDPSGARVPDTVLDVLMTRIDRLADLDRLVLRSAAVIGRDVPALLVQAVTELPRDTVRATLARLQAAEFLYATRLGAEPEYTFKHALTLDVAHESVPEEDRPVLHARVVSSMERLYADRLTDHVERLADHARRGGLWEKAAAYSRQAGLKAAAHSAYREAAAHFEAALAALTHLPATPATRELGIDLRLDLRGSLTATGDFAHVLDHLRQAEALATEAGDEIRLGRVCAYLTSYYRQRGEHAPALEAGQRALAIAERHGDPALRISAGIYLGHIHYDVGNYRRASDLFGAVVASVTEEQRHEQFGLPYIVSVHARTWVALSLGELGQFGDALARAREALAIAESTDHPTSLTSACTGLGRVCYRAGRLDEAIPVLERAEKLARERNIQLLLPTILEPLGLAYAESGRLADGVRLLEEALEVHAATRGTAGQAWRLASLSQGYLLAGRGEDAMRTGHLALELADKYGERGLKVYSLSVLANAAALATPPDRDGAARWRREAFALAEELGMMPLARPSQEPAR